jgi:2',3'-cyclic-nucleotide 2'-phosphodiesterase (5'-nucleotidase family)
MFSGRIKSAPICAAEMSHSAARSRGASLKTRSGLRWTAVTALAMSLSLALPASAAVLAGWDVHAQAGGANNFGASPLAATVTDPNLTVVGNGLLRGTGVNTTGTGAARGWGGVNWVSTSAAAAATANQYAAVTLQANSGYQVSYSAISKLDYRRSATGATTGVVQYQVGAGAFVDIASVNYASTSSAGASLPAIDLSGIATLQNVPAATPVTFRVVNYGASGATGTWYIFDVANTTANDFEISGTVSAGTGSINGACGKSNGQTLGSAPTTNLCSLGTASGVAGTGPWTWTCAGSGGGSSASCSANAAAGGPFTIFHMNDVHARLTPHKWVISKHSNTQAGFDDVGGAAYLAGKLEALTAANPTALVLDGGDISEGSPLGDMNNINPDGTAAPGGASTSTYGDQGQTLFYELLNNKLKLVPGRSGRGIDALVVGNHDVRDVSYVTNMEHMRNVAGIPVISANVRDIATHAPHFPATTTLTVNGVKVGIVGYTTPSAVVGTSLTSTLEVVTCDWKSTNAANCHIADYVNDLRNNQGCQVVILLTHDGHSDLVDPTGPVLADTADAKVPEIAVTGHWHTWTDTVWQPVALNYKTIFTESASYMKYVGELNVDATGKYISAQQHVLRNADITPDPDVLLFVENLKSAYQASTGHAANEVVGYSSSDLMLDNVMKWWSADEYPWSGNNTAGQWITDGMKWNCDIVFAANGGCDLAVEAGGGVRADIPAGWVTHLQIYETFPWADDTYYRINMTGQDIMNFLKATNLDAGFSGDMDVTAFDGVISSVLIHGQPLNLTTVYKVAINNYMYAHPPAGYAWTDASPLTSTVLVRESLVSFMQTAHPDVAHAYNVGGDRYHLNGEYSGGYRAVVTMMNDADSKLTFEDAFIRFIATTPETLARRGTKQVPSSLVNADGSIVTTNRLAEQELYRSYMGFKTGALVPGDIIETWGKASFYGGNPEFVDQEGVNADGVEFKIVGHDASLAKPTHMGSIGALLTDNYKNHYVQFLGKKTAADTVVDQYSQSLKIWDKTGYTAKTLPGNVGDVLLITGVPTMESYSFRFRSDNATVSALALPVVPTVTSHVDALPQVVNAASLALTATAGLGASGYYLAPVADAQVASGNATTNYGATTNMFIQSSSVSTFGNERAWLKFDLSTLPAGTAITGATLQLWNYKSTGAALPVEVRGSSTDTWTETGLNWNNQPLFGSALATQTLASGATNLWYSWDVTSFVQGEFAGDKLVSLALKAVTESSTDATAPGYGFDTKEYGSNAPVLHVTTQASASAVASVSFFYRYSADNTNWGAWTQTGSALTVAPYGISFNFPSGVGYYEFYSVATDNLGGAEAAPAYAQAAIHYTAASGSAQTINFAGLAPVTVGTAVSLPAVTATSGLAVTLASTTPSICSLSGNVVTTLTVGNCTLTATQDGAVGYWLAASVSQSFASQAVAQNISFAAIADRQLSSGAVSLSATATSGLAVQFASLTTSVCSVTGNSVNLLAVGVCTIAADQPGNASVAAATTVTQTFHVTAAYNPAEDIDTPIPAWALAALGLGLLGAMRRNAKRRD